ncbi:MAG: hypothetical protein M0T73_14835 [Deltaproteobacteria bacterium]|nr:hypothetical protein [Deltaproteobacteria bacterium]
MIKIKTVNGIKTSSEIKSYRSLRHAVGAPVSALDWGRMKMGQAKRLAKKDWKIWFQAGTKCGMTKRVLGS